MDNPRKTGAGSRLAGAKVKGAAAFADGKAATDNPYKRPNMAKEWAAGFDEALAGATTQEVTA